MSEEAAIFQENPMKALILRNEANDAVATARVLIEKAVQILCVETPSVAHALIRIDTIDRSPVKPLPAIMPSNPIEPNSLFM